MVKYFPLAMRIARSFPGGDTDVLEGAALDGLIDAALRYERSNYEQERFMQFARQRIAGAIVDVRVATIGKQKEPRRFVEFDEGNAGTYEMHGLGFDVLEVPLTEQERTVLHMLFWQDMKQSEVAREIDRAQCRVSQLKFQALARIRGEFAARGITRLDQIL